MPVYRERVWDAWRKILKMRNDPLQSLISHFRVDGPAESLFLPRVPPRKFPPLQYAPFPRKVLVPLVAEIAFRTVLPISSDEKESTISTKKSFHSYIMRMVSDRDLVIKQPLRITLSTSPPSDVDLKLEYCFANRLLRRIQNAPYEDLEETPYFYHFLADLIAQNIKYSDALQVSQDDSGNSWLRLRGQKPYRDKGFYSDTTTLVNAIGALVRIVFAETDDDIDNWYRYEWMSQYLKDILVTQPLGSEIKLSKQRTFLNHIFGQFSKLFTQHPR